MQRLASIIADPRFLTAVLGLALLLGGPRAIPQTPAPGLEGARRLVAEGRIEEAIAAYEKLLSARPDDPALIVNLAVVEFKAGRYERVVERCQKALRLAPGLATASLFLGAGYFQLGRHADAVQPLEAAVAAQPQERNARLMLAESLLVLERFREAAGHFQPASELLPDRPRVWYGLERSYSSLADEAKAELERSAPNSAYAFALAGEEMLRAAQYGRALHLFRTSLAAGEALPGIHASIAAVYDASGHAGWAAREREREKAAACPDKTARCHFLAGRYGEAALAEGSAPETLYWRARAAGHAADAALDRLRRLPPSAELREVDARRLDRRGRYLEAAKAWTEALDLAPDSAVLERGLALSLFNGRDLAAALPRLERLVKRQPGSAELQFLLGSCLVQLEEPARAVPVLEAALRLDGEAALAHGSLGEAYLKLGQPAKAIPHLKAALAADQDGSRHFQLARAYQANGDRQLASRTIAQYRIVRAEWEAKRRELEADYPIGPPG
ncbi:MAG: tetratricopeptide repeat protein [Bryobacteraceae bacterium]|nr:tetratricopeptide repeat protein [Bryobacteraceae bacterium]